MQTPIRDQILLPPISDEDSWKRLASSEAWWREATGKDLCKSYRQIRANPGQATRWVIETISGGLRKRLWWDVRSGVDHNLPNKGNDTVKATVDYLFDELDIPDSADGLALCLIYSVVVQRRRIDHVRHTLSEMRLSTELVVGHGGQIAGASEALPPHPNEQVDVDVEALLAAITDKKKREAFSLRHVSRTKVQDIAAKYGVDVRTINRWDIETRKALFAAIKGTQEE